MPTAPVLVERTDEVLQTGGIHIFLIELSTRLLQLLRQIGQTEVQQHPEDEGVAGQDERGPGSGRNQPLRSDTQEILGLLQGSCELRIPEILHLHPTKETEPGPREGLAGAEIVRVKVFPTPGEDSLAQQLLKSGKEAEDPQVP